MPKRGKLEDRRSEGQGRWTAKVVWKVFDPARLTQAREAVGITKRELAGRLGASAAAIGQYEAGAIRPRVEQLERLAQLLSVPVGFFAAGRPRAPLDASMAHFRSLRSTRVHERNRAVAFAEQTWELAYALSRHVHLPRLDLPGWDDGAGGEPLPAEGGAHVTWSDPMAAARVLRERWGLGDGPVPHLVRTLESKGVLIAILAFSGSRRIDAFSSSHTPRPVIVLTRDKDDVYRHRFNAAHELGHLVLHGEALPGDLGHEREANAFAAEFLLPAHRLVDLLPSRLDLGALLRLQRAWGASVESLLYRSQELGVLSPASHRRGRIRLHELRRSGAVAFEPISDYPGECPALLRKAFDLSTQRSLTMNELSAALALPPRRIRDLLGQVDERPALRLV